MAEVTVSQLAKTVGATVDRLLAQMKEAGLDHSSGEQPVSDDDKQRLLTHLKSSHGVSTEAPKRITLKRRTIGTVKTSGSQGKKTVAVEVRKKRTYVKRDDEDLELEPDADLENEALAAEAAADAAAAALAAAEGEAANSAAQSGESDDAAPTTRRIDPFDVEELRRRAASKRKEQEVTEKARRDAVVKNKAEEAARVKAEAAARVNQAEKEKTAGPKHFKAAPGLRTDDDELRFRSD